MLRTCSEPDLLKLFRTNLVENPFFTDDEAAAVHVRADVTRHDAAAAVVDDDDDDDDDDDANENDGATSPPEVEVLADNVIIPRHHALVQSNTGTGTSTLYPWMPTFNLYMLFHRSEAPRTCVHIVLVDKMAARTCRPTHVALRRFVVARTKRRCCRSTPT